MARNHKTIRFSALALAGSLAFGVAATANAETIEEPTAETTVVEGASDALAGQTVAPAPLELGTTSKAAVDAAVPAAAPVQLTGWQRSGNLWNLYDANGRKLTGWQFNGGAWYLFDANGTMLTGWQLDGNTWYYLYGNGVLASGWLNDGGTWYYLAGSGALIGHSWINWYGTWYYVNGGGIMVTGTQWIGGQQSNFDSNGRWLGYVVTDWRQKMADLSKQYTWVPYYSPGANTNGWDCSGMVRWIYNQVTGKTLPHSVNGQAARGYQISASEARPGDLWFRGSPGSFYHVAIYVGNNEIVHAEDWGVGTEHEKIYGSGYFYRLND